LAGAPRPTTRAWPVFGSMQGYRMAWLRPDVVAGLTVWAVLVPEALAYATIAGVPPVVGLYAAVPALVLYAAFGNSRTARRAYPARIAFHKGRTCRADCRRPRRTCEQRIRERPGLRPRTVELYRWLLAKHIAPHLGGVALGKLSTAIIRRWRAELLASGASTSEVDYV
jgi:hypothetical protein